MRQAFAHDAVLDLDPDGDERSPGGAITVALCGRSEHPMPCPVASHHTDAQRSGDEVTLRVLFATEPEDEGWVRRVIDDVLARGWGEDPDGVRTSWRLVRSDASPVRPDEEDHAGRLARG